MNKKFENNKEWQESNKLVLDIYKLLSGMPKEEYEDPYSLSNEIKNAAIGVPCKLSAGYELGGDYLTENLMIASGLLAKLESLLLLAIDVKLVEDENAEELIKRIKHIDLAIDKDCL